MQATPAQTKKGKVNSAPAPDPSKIFVDSRGLIRLDKLQSEGMIDTIRDIVNSLAFQSPAYLGALADVLRKRSPLGGSLTQPSHLRLVQPT